MASEPKGYIRVPVWVDGGVVKPLVNDDGRIPVLLDLSSITLDVNLKSSDITLGVTESTPLTSIQARLYGWDGTDWNKQGHTWNYFDTYGVYAEADDVAAGNRIMLFGQVPAGYIYVLTGVTAWCLQSNPVSVGFEISIDDTWIVIYRAAYPTALMTLNWSGFVPMKKDDRVRLRFYTCALNDDIRGTIQGYAMKVNEG